MIVKKYYSYKKYKAVQRELNTDVCFYTLQSAFELLPFPGKINKFKRLLLKKYSNFVLKIKFLFWHKYYVKSTIKYVDWIINKRNVVIDHKVFFYNYYDINKIKNIGRQLGVKISTKEIHKYDNQSYYHRVYNPFKWLIRYDNIMLNDLLKTKGVKKQYLPSYITTIYCNSLKDMLAAANIGENELTKFDCDLLRRMILEIPSYVNLYNKHGTYSAEMKYKFATLVQKEHLFLKMNDLKTIDDNIII